MTIGELLDKCQRDFEVIEFRHVISIDSDDVDVLYGFCSYHNGELISLDNDSYSIEDKIKKYILYKDNWLVIWI